MNNNEIKIGVFYAGFSYFIWGLLPIYWKFLHHVNADEILMNRIFWSFIFMVGVLLITKKWGEFILILKNFRTNKKQLFALIIASLLVSCNWFIYIWAVNTDQIIEASLGYYINPLVSVLLGMIVFREKLSSAQYASFALAAVGVLILTLSYGKFPWIAILLALTFGIYGLLKKMIKVESSIGLTLETLVVAPIALIYIVFLFAKGTQSFLSVSVGTDLFLIGAGAATAIPLLYFAKGAQKIPMSTLGFLQFIAPTISLILGVFVYHEQFTKIHLISFIFIWSAITLYSLSKTKLFVHLETRKKKEIA
ncbi:EamA family transporter RarD [Bacillus sp. S/N-304-OC-R1]|uniref:EamA family transporter RarD n=1 Tax=Bacillus sp. S/N-304-OC-R1 TaxID=2758034 RepID=UPI001C8EF8E7|nr:EamA family transporter RarD [Bacillus sp. S/N-304-OC-R1]MBY0124098.1 EamA family transporter RarD [Bacillus sp. S/N-304-OC-R1]